MGDKKGKCFPPPLKKYMHSRNPYKTPPSFKMLASKYPDFRTYCSYDVDGKVRFDFKNSDALRALAVCLLENDFDLKVSIPPDRLVPTIPLRLNYLLWIEDLLSFVSNKKGKCNSVQYPIVGYDIGTGASCIYPLLGVKKNGWRFVATETDEISFECAKENICRNNLENSINLKKSSSLFGVLDDDEVKRSLEKININCNVEEEGSVSSSSKVSLPKQFDESSSIANNSPKFSEFPIAFTMCNPPFFSSEGEIDSVAKSKKSRSEPTNASTGSIHEMVTEGGEVAFIGEIMKQSVTYKDHIGIFSSLVGAKSDLSAIKRNLSQISPTPAHFSVTEFCQGRTMRWGIAWTFQSDYLLERVVCKRQKLNEKPSVLLVSRALLSNYSVTYAYKKLEEWLKEIKLKTRLFKKTKYFIGASLSAYKATWLNQRRAKREQKRKQICDNEKAASHTEVKNLKRKNEDLCNENDSKKFRDDKILCDSSSGSVEEDDEESVNDAELGCKLATCYIDTTAIESKKESSENCNLLPTPEDSPKMIVECEDDVESDSKIKSKSGLDCILRCNVGVKQTNNLISYEFRLTGGTKGKDAMNQLVQYIHNKLKGI